MTTAQHKIGSGFGARSTVHDVLRGIDPAGRLTLVTGGYSGLGLETTRALPTAGARVLVPARRVDVARKAVDGIGGVEVAGLDLGGLESTRTFAERFPASGRTLYIVINSAGIAVCPETRVGPGWEIQFAANHLGYYALVNRLWPAIERDGDRVVTVSSRGHRLSDIRWDDPHFTNGAYDKARTTSGRRTASRRPPTSCSPSTWMPSPGRPGYGRSRCIPALGSAGGAHGGERVRGAPLSGMRRRSRASGTAGYPGVPPSGGAGSPSERSQR